MKKFIFFVLIAACLALPMAAYAIPGDKIVNVSSEAVPDSIKLGETISLTVSTERKGAAFTDAWENATKVDTVYDESTGNYVSKAEFKPTQPGSYEIRYSIQMQRGKSGKVFSGEFSKTVTVTDEKKVIGADIRDTVETPVIRSGNIAGYSIIGNVYMLFSDGSAKPADEMVSFYIGSSEKGRDIQVSFEYDGTSYDYTVHYVH